MNKEFEIIVIGSGIAGLTAGLTSARLGRRTLVLTGTVLGGQLLSIERIEGYPGYADGVAGYDLCPTVQAQAMSAGAEFAMSEATRLTDDDGRWLVSTTSGEHSARAVILATGTSLRELDVPGEAMLRGKGVSHCASCDAPLLSGKHVVVIGGGDSALQEALTLAEHAARVTILHRGDDLKAQASFRERVAANARIDVRPGLAIREIVGEQAVAGVRVSDVATGEDERIDAEGVFIYIGLAPNVTCLDGLLDLDATGHIITDDRLRTVRSGALAAGTVRAGAYFRSVSAAGEGSAAAISADRFLVTNNWRA